MINKEKLLKNLDSKYASVKKSSLKKLIKLESANSELVSSEKELVPINFSTNVCYSLYSPTMCAYSAHKNGCYAVAINDFATLLGYKEFKDACEILNIPYAAGYHIECKPLFNEKKGVLYGYGVAYKNVKDISCELSEIRLSKKQSIIKTIENINKSIAGYGITIPVKWVIKNKKQVITEKNLAIEIAHILIKKFGKDDKLLEFLKTALKIDSCETDLRFLKEQENSYFEEDLAKVIYNKYNLLKSREKREDAKKFTKLNSKYGVISAYKVDIKKFEEGALKNIAETLKANGFNAVAFKTQNIEKGDLDRIVDYFLESGLLPISLYRMGLPRQHMPSVEDSSQLFLNGLAVVGNAISVNCDEVDGLFGANTVNNCESLKKRVELFSNIVKGRR